MSLQPGDPAPDFDLPSDGGGHVRLADFKGKKVVLYFYPKDDTSGCTSEAQAFTAAAPDFKAAGAAVVGVSKDSVKSHDKFKAKYDLNFALWPQIYGHRTRHLPDRRRRPRRQGLAQGQGDGSRRRGAEGRS
jgi:peroxiredoxin